MDNDAKINAAPAALGMAALILGLLVGGAGVYVFLQRQQAAAAQRGAIVARAQSEAILPVERAGANAGAKADALEGANEQDASLDEDGDAVRGAVESIRADVKAVLRDQETAWNRGDLDGFAEHYWKSDDLSFSSGGKTTRGWADTVRGYKERYATPAEMGRLTLNGLEITPLGDGAALVLGQWKVERENEPLDGNFSLVLRKIDGRWVIVHDHTSRRVE